MRADPPQPIPAESKFILTRPFTSHSDSHSGFPAWLWLIPLLLLAMWLGARGLTADILFVDEYWSIRNSGGDPFTLYSLSAVWERTATLDPGGMGVLYHWLLHIWGRLAGWSVFSVRVFSLLFGLLTIAATYRLGVALFNRQVALYTAVVLAGSAFFVDYLHEARAYTLLMFVTVCAVYSYHRLMHIDTHPNNASALLWYPALTLSLAALAYTHYVALAMGAVLGVYHLLRFQMSRRWWAVVLAMAAGGALFLPWLSVTLEVISRGTTDTGRQADSMHALQILRELAQAFTNMNLALFALLAIYALNEQTRRGLLVLLWIGVALVLVLLINALIPFMVHLRYLLFIWMALALVGGLGIYYLGKAGVPAALIAAIWLLVGVYQALNPAFINQQFGQIYRAPADGFHQALDLLHERAQPDDMALLHIIPPGYEPFNYFVLGYYLDDTPFQYDQIERINNSFAGGDNDYLRDVQAALQDVPAVWTLVMPQLETTQRSAVVDYYLRTSYLNCGTLLDSSQMQVSLYMPPPAGFADAQFLHSAENNATVDLYHTGRDGQRGDVYSLPLMYTADAVPPGRYSVGVYLVDDSGNTVTQSDFGLPDARPNGCITAHLSLTDVAPGMYTAQMVVYNWQTGERLIQAATASDVYRIESVKIE